MSKSPKKGFGPPPEVTAYFDGKALRPAFSWLDVWAEEHAHSFTVAKATELELLTTFRDSIANAIREGRGFDTWKEDIRKDLTLIGWGKPRLVSDPAGGDPEKLVDFMSERRLKTIFWSNINSARAAGQWERAQRSKGVLPYFLYVRTTSADPRPEHLTWVGIILPIDDPFWSSHFPPNGWRCKCQVRQISQREASDLLGREPQEGKPSYSDTPPDLGPDIVHRNRRTGEITKVPPGIDPGWHTNPGLARSTTLLNNLETKLASAAAPDATKALADLWQDPFLRLAPQLPEKTWLPAGISKRLVDEFPGVKTPVVSIAANTITERVAKHGMTMDDFALMPSVIERGTILPDENGDPSVRMILAKVGKAFWRMFVKRSANGYLRVNSFHPRRARDMERKLKERGMSIVELKDLLEE